MPRRKKEKAERKVVQPPGPGDGPPEYKLEGDPAPTKAERQAEWERVLGLRPGDLDEKLVEQRDRAHQAYVRAQIDEAYGIQKGKP